MIFIPFIYVYTHSCLYYEVINMDIVALHCVIYTFPYYLFGSGEKARLVRLASVPMAYAGAG